MDDINIGFLGLGLIGGSIARAIKKSNPQAVIQVYTRRKNPNLEKGKQEGVIDELRYEIDEHFSNCDFIFLCAPVLNNIDFLHQLKDIINDKCIITDVGSVKGNIHTAVKELSLENNFIGGHPMAGSEKTGYENSRADLLKDSFYLLTPTEYTTKDNLKRLEELITCTQSTSIIINPSDHDDITAAISHLPHIIATSLVNMIQSCDTQDEKMKKFAAGGFRDVTRIAASSPEMWESICISNQSSIDSFLSQYIDCLSDFRKMLASGNKDELKQFFEDASNYRKSLPEFQKENKEN